MDNRQQIYLFSEFSLYKIGDYIFNTKLAQIECPAGKCYELTSLPFELLTFLVVNNDRLVNKRELILKVWQHEVSDSSINKMISELRGIFGDTAKDSKYIATRRKLGYRLVANVSILSDALPAKPTSTIKVSKLNSHIDNEM